MQTETKKRIVWFAVFMLWIGMVASLIYHNTDSEQYSAIDDITSTNTEVILTRNSVAESPNSSNPVNIQVNKGQEEKAKKDLLVDYRLERDKARSEQVNNYRELINNPNTDATIKKHAQELLLEMTERIEQEMEIESLIRAAGFSDAVAFLHDNSIDLIVQCDNGLTREEAAKIGDIVVRITGLRFEDISITENRISPAR